MNPYAATRETEGLPINPAICARRADVVCIALVLATAAVGSLASIGIPSAREVLMPRFGWGGLTLLLFPLNFIGLYLWKPAPRLLAMAGFMCVFVSAINALMILRTGTVATVSNAFHDRLPSSYAWSVFPILAVGLYLFCIAWIARSHVSQPDA